MKVSELIKELETVNPNAKVILYDAGDTASQAGGILVTDNDDDLATEIAILNSGEHKKAFGKKNQNE